MSGIPSDRDSIFEYPCRFFIKAIGYNRPEFRSTILALAQRHAPEVMDGDIQQRYSADHNYLALTITMLAQSRAQLDAIYTELSRHELVLMAL
ncbi:MAG: DUF493 domain-containing protein [Pseudomonadota bacterium]